MLTFECAYFSVIFLVLKFILNHLPPSIRKKYALINRALSSYVSGKMIASISTLKKLFFTILIMKIMSLKNTSFHSFLFPTISDDMLGT